MPHFGKEIRMTAQQNRNLFLHWTKSLGTPAWAPSLVFVVYVVALSFSQVYQKYPFLDIPTHFFGGLAMAYFLDKAFINPLLLSHGVSPNRVLKNVLIFTSTCSVAVFWELAEFALSSLLSIDFQGGLADTMKDLFFGMSGGLFYVAAVGRTCIASRLLDRGAVNRLLRPEEYV
jgi:hypothetical protein